MRCSSSEAGSSGGSDERRRAARHEHLLALLGQADDGHLGGARAQRLERRRELPLAAVDHDQVRPAGEALVVALVGAVVGGRVGGGGLGRGAPADRRRGQTPEAPPTTSRIMAKSS